MPCQHRGVCIPVSVDKYTCDCPKGYCGKSCEKLTLFRWLRNKLNLNQILTQKFVLTGKLIWGVINNIPLLHNAALRHLYLSSSIVNSESQIWYRNNIYKTIDDYYNHSFLTRGLPPVPRECPTPLGIKGPKTLPNVDVIFDVLFQRKNFKPCRLGTNLMFATFAQHLAYQFFKTNSPEQYFFGSHEDSFFRMYGSDETARRALRSLVNGKLRARILNGEEYPPYLRDVRGVSMHYPPKAEGEKSVFPKWAMGHKMFSITPMMFVMATIWLREHNRVCDVIIKAHPEWNDERIYQTARLIVLGEVLTITAGEFLQHFAQYRLKLGYKPHLFQNKPITTTSQMQYEFGLTFQWHQMLPDELFIQGKYYNMSELIFSNNRIIFEHGLDAIVDAMSRKPVGEITYRNCGKTFKNVMMRLIEEGRKNRLHSFNDYRRFYNLKPYNSFLELVGNKEMADALENFYGDIDAVEFLVGIFMEKHKSSVSPPTMLYLTAPVALREILTNPMGSFALWRSSTFGGKRGFEIVQKASLKRLFCLNLKGNCKNNVWVSFKTPSDVTAVSKRINSALS